MPDPGPDLIRAVQAGCNGTRDSNGGSGITSCCDTAGEGGPCCNPRERKDA